MAVVTTPQRSFLGKTFTGLRRPTVPARLKAALGPVVTLAREHLVTLAAFAAIDLGAFEATPVAGWIVTGLTLLAFDYQVRG